MAVDVEAPVALDLLRVVAEPMRWRILALLAVEELCVCHLVEELAAAQPLVSHHLRVLRDAGLVETSRHRYWTYYRLRPGALTPLADALGRLVDAPIHGGGGRRPCC
ncbi:MAG: transcriptional regulator [Actinobacteria bacterium]|nr:MAG: transcriptional regulator [Actinomycetota bacterium]